jgi:hypothetical protein
VLIGRVGDRGACSSATILDSESYVLVRHEVERAGLGQFRRQTAVMMI